ncbi:sodium-independent sulfate anion transporter-like [Ranitomeya variabilis]|uniref:sodium-independent sulfate anion transporter-like n=1 Tax=Ranitomeya variabilis TaxID=490064 RepID=UPI004056F6C9
MAARNKAGFKDSLPQSVVLDFTHVNVLDYTVVMGLRELQQEFQSQERPLLYSGLQPDILQILLAASLKDFQHPQGMTAEYDIYDDESIEPLLNNAS